MGEGGSYHYTSTSVTLHVYVYFSSLLPCQVHCAWGGGLLSLQLYFFGSTCTCIFFLPFSHVLSGTHTVSSSVSGGEGGLVASSGSSAEGGESRSPQRQASLEQRLSELICISRKAFSHNYCTAVTVILQFSRSGLPFAFSLITTQTFHTNQYVHENSVGYSSANLRDNHPIACSGKPNFSERQSHLGA